MDEPKLNAISAIKKVKKTRNSNSKSIVVVGGGIQSIPIMEPHEPGQLAVQRYSNNKTTVEDGGSVIRSNNVILPHIGSVKFNQDL